MSADTVSTHANSPATLRGQCLCGAVRYAVKNAFRYSFICHCSQCRRATGSAFKPFAGIESAALRLTEGKGRTMIYGDPPGAHDVHCGPRGREHVSIGAAIPVSPHDCPPSCRWASLGTSFPLVPVDCEPHMDLTTIETYTSRAANFAAEWANQPAPDDLYARLRAYFHLGGSTVDIGCGSGRDVAWLNANGYPAVGYDASAGLIAQAGADHPQCAFGLATLPELSGVANASFDNVLCETVIMHLPVAQVASACRRLVELLKPRGVLYLSWRVTDGDSARDAAGRLYSAFDPALVTDALQGTAIALDERSVNRSSGKRVQRIVAIRA